MSVTKAVIIMSDLIVLIVISSIALAMALGWLIHVIRRVSRANGTSTSSGPIIV